MLHCAKPSHLVCQACNYKDSWIAGAIPAYIRNRQVEVGAGEEAGSPQPTALPELPPAPTGGHQHMAGAVGEASLSAEVPDWLLPPVECVYGFLAV